MAKQGFNKNTNNDDIEIMDYIPVPVVAFRKVGRELDFDIFLEVSRGNWVHVFSKTTGVDYKRMAQYLTRGVQHLWIRAEDENRFKAFTSVKLDHILKNPALSSDKKIATLINLTEATIAELFSSFSLSEDIYADTQTTVKNYIKMVTTNPKGLAMMLKLISHGDYLYYHSVTVSVFSLILAQSSDALTETEIENVGLGGFLHDIGSSMIPQEIFDLADELSPKQWREIKDHPKLGLQMIESNPSIPDEVRYIVYQHHEHPIGSGYPNGLKGENIFGLAKVVAVADAFSALISKRPYRQASTPEQAIHLMKSEGQKYDLKWVTVLESVFSKKSNQKAA